MNVANVVQVLAGLSWLLVIGSLALVGVSAARGGKVGGMIGLVIGAIILALALNLTAAGLVFIEPQESGVVVSALQPNGIRPDPLRPGLSWVVPFFETVRAYSISKQTYTMTSVSDEGQVAGDDSIKTRTKDGQEVYIDASVIYAIDPTKVVSLHTTWQDRYQDDLVRPLARGVIRDFVSQYGVEEIVSSKRAELEDAITQELEERFSANNLILDDFIIRNVTFTEQYAEAVEQKQIAEQLAQQAQFVVEQRRQEAEQARQVAQGQADAAVIAAKGDAESRLIQAQAEAEALKLIAQALAENPQLVEYTYVQKLGGNVQVMLVPSNSPYLFNLPEVATTDSTSTVVVPTPAPTPTP